MNTELTSTVAGSMLIRLCREAARELVLVAPFIKARPLDRLLTDLADSTKLTCVTRWLPAEIAAGVSDIETFDIIERHGGQLWLRQDLHAKYFRGDTTVIVGSANLTGAALGWSTRSNLELLIRLDQEANGIAGFERHVLEGSTEVDRDLYDFMSSAEACQLSNQDLNATFDLPIVADSERVPIGTWVPVLRHPGILYRIYRSVQSGTIPSISYRAGVCDLAVLQPPQQLSEDTFNEVIATTLLTMPVVNLVDRVLATPRRFGAVRNLLRERLGITHDEASLAWQTLLRWFRHFLSERYEYSRPRHSEVVSRVRRGACS